MSNSTYSRVNSGIIVLLLSLILGCTPDANVQQIAAALTQTVEAESINTPDSELATETPTPTPPDPVAISATLTSTTFVTESVNSSPTSTLATETPISVNPDVTVTVVAPSPTAQTIVEATIRRSGPSVDEYFVQGEGINLYNLNEFIVVYAKDAAGFEFDAAVMYVVDKNPDTLIARTVFQNPAVNLEDLAALRVDNNLIDANLTQMISVNKAFVGFTLAEGQIRLNPNEQIREGDQLMAVALQRNGDALPLSPELLFHVDTVSISGEMARVSIIGATSWPTEWTLLIPQNRSSNYTIAVNDFMAESGICVRQGDKVKISATGMMIVGEFVGMLGPEGKEHFQLGGLFTTPIDPIYDIIPELPHGVLLFRIADPTLSATEGWMHYDAIKQFTADKAGCLEFDMNDKDNTDNSGAFTVQVDINP